MLNIFGKSFDIALANESDNCMRVNLEGVNPDRYCAIIQKLLDKKIALHFIVHGESGGQIDKTMEKFEHFIQVFKETYGESLKFIDYITIGGDWNFPLTLSNQEKLNDKMFEEVLHNRERLSVAILKQFPSGYLGTLHFSKGTVKRERDQQNPFNNSQIFKNDYAASVAEVMGACILERQDNVQESVLTSEGNIIAEFSKTFVIGASYIDDSNYINMDHLPVFVRSSSGDLVCIYANLVPFYGNRGINRPPVAMSTEEMQQHAVPLMTMFNQLATNLIQSLTPDYNGSIKEWSYDCKFENVELELERFFSDCVSDPRFRSVVKLLVDKGAVISIKDTIKDNSVFQKVSYYNNQKEHADQNITEITENKVIKAFLFNAKRVLLSKTDKLAALTINKLTNDILTSLGQQLAAGYSLSPYLLNLMEIGFAPETIRQIVTNKQQQDLSREIVEALPGIGETKQGIKFIIEAKEHKDLNGALLYSYPTDIINSLKEMYEFIIDPENLEDIITEVNQITRPSCILF